MCRYANEELITCRFAHPQICTSNKVFVRSTCLKHETLFWGMKQHETPKPGHETLKLGRETPKLGHETPDWGMKQGETP
jgi:hypothetical protein